MSWFRRSSLRRAINQKVRLMDISQRHKYLTFFRVAYFFAASSLLMTVYNINKKIAKSEEEKENQKKLEAGHPVIRDESPAHAAMREKGTEAGVLYKYSLEKGWHLEEYHRGEYLSRLQKKALDDAREAQRKALSEGRELSPDAILLIDESGSS